jgi:hypothetical protein
VLTQAQADLLAWIVESGSGEVPHVQVGNAREDVAIIPDGPRQVVNPTDFRELVEKGLIRHVNGQLHELTNEGRVAYQELTSLRPPQRPPVGFHPSG